MTLKKKQKSSFKLLKSRPQPDLRFEAELVRAADRLRGNLEPSEYEHVDLGLVFLKYISEAFDIHHAKLAADEFADEEDPEEYLAENIFWVSRESRWSHLRDQAFAGLDRKRLTA